ncbi:MAG: hypothetical protein CVU43_16430 [Chloroflexi bacterium HGW-Chloroflexi-5]|jgi:hypothetical protein|nr:MAG: hypothetical protein CVV47_15035 [Spirochaetae bacterium HGW-Spirochaetae-3]PKN98234.1 MAG: hypothetical protein CVU43_16430 [Chloroflexi bacterium HGW-Chloroflexi-5]
MYEIKKAESGEKDFGKALFVCKAILADSIRPFTRVVHVEHIKSGSRLVCTDGHRLHVAEIALKIESGDYEPVVTKGSIILRGPVDGAAFPNWKRIVPQTATEKGIVSLGGSDLGKNEHTCEKMSLAFFSIMGKTGEPVNLRFLDDLPKQDLKVFVQEKRHRALLFRPAGEDEGIYAVIMPIAA